MLVRAAVVCQRGNIMKSKLSAALVAVGCVLSLSVGTAKADTVTLVATSQGFIDQNGNAAGGNNYLAGNCGTGDCGVGEFRNFFAFAIPLLSGPVVSASLVLDTFNVNCRPVT